jgi:mannose/cellobiose epimerase-like protein (N-acyl-D-glucosamine 2-epimerase family)
MNPDATSDGAGDTDPARAGSIGPDPTHAGSVGRGPTQGGPTNTGPANTGPAHTGPANTAPANTAPANTGPAHTDPATAASPHAPTATPALRLDTTEGRRRELGRLLAFAERSLPDPDAPFVALDGRGDPDLEQGHPLLITTRMTHVFGLATLLGLPDADRFASAGVAALRGPLRDAEHGGWFAGVGAGPDRQPTDTVKQMYGHAFVVLAGATAATAGVPGGRKLLDEALGVVERYFWDEGAGACRESFDAAWEHGEAYRGANSNMHAVEAFLAAVDAGADPVWARRALRIAERLIDQEAAARRWRRPEHYDERWLANLQYAADSPADPFRPYGVTAGHMLEWSRLLVHLDAALEQPPSWLLADARGLIDTALDIGWRADGHPGLVYTLDEKDQPVVAQRMHWVAAEAVLAADVMARRTGEPTYAATAQELWRDVERFVDLERGSWQHELAPDGTPASTVWDGKPDVYHAFQAVLLPDLPLAPSVAGAVVASRSAAG